MKESSNENPEQTRLSAQNFLLEQLEDPFVRAKDTLVRVNVATTNMA